MNRAQKQSLRERIVDIGNDREALVREYLEACGWKRTSNVPGSVWQWERTLPDGRTVLAAEEIALYIAGWELALTEDGNEQDSE